MSHTYEYKNTVFICNSDLSGDITIRPIGGGSLEVNGDDLKSFIFDYLRRGIISNIENLDNDELEKLLTNTLGD